MNLSKNRKLNMAIKYQATTGPILKQMHIGLPILKMT